MSVGEEEAGWLGIQVGIQVGMRVVGYYLHFRFFLSCHHDDDHAPFAHGHLLPSDECNSSFSLSMLS